MLNETRLDIASFAVRGHEVHETAHIFASVSRGTASREEVGWLAVVCWCGSPPQTSRYVLTSHSLTCAAYSAHCERRSFR